jgi:hypothetical protein
MISKIIRFLQGVLLFSLSIFISAIKEKSLVLFPNKI